MSQENVELAHRIAESLNARDLDAFLALHDHAVDAQTLLGDIEGTNRGHEGVRRWCHSVLEASPDFSMEIIETRDLGDMTFSKFKATGHGAGSDIPFEQTLWGVARWHGKKIVWARVFTSRVEALEAARLRE